MTKVTEKTETATIVNGVVLTNEAIDQLLSLQKNNNETINSVREDIADSICLLAIFIDNYSHEPTRQKASRAMLNLSYIRDYFDELRKP